jgi:hypothetical protein
MLLCFLGSLKLVGFCVPIIGRWLLVIGEYAKALSSSLTPNFEAIF